MKTRPLKNYQGSIGCEVYDFDASDPIQWAELGHIYAKNAIVFLDVNISTRQLYDIMISWGQPSRALMHNYVIDKKLKGRHWRDIFLNLGYITKEVMEQDRTMSDAVSVITYRTDEKNRPKGMFTVGELGWHSDQIGMEDAPRVIGLQSVSDSANSQTQFLCTHDAYESMSSSLQSMIKELICKHRWREGLMAPGVDYLQSQILRLNMCPVDGLETPLYSELVSGIPGIHLPTHTFDGFVGMSEQESQKLYKEICTAIYDPRWAYTQDWKDGQIVFMDQEITLHKRPTNVSHGSKRNMARVITYLDTLYPSAKPFQKFRYRGEIIDHDILAKLVDESRLAQFQIEQAENLVEA